MEIVDGGRRVGFAMGQVRMMRMTSWKGWNECCGLDYGSIDESGALWRLSPWIDGLLLGLQRGPPLVFGLRRASVVFALQYLWMLYGNRALWLL